MLKQLLAFTLFLTIVSASSIHLIFPKDVTYSRIIVPSKVYGEPNYLGGNQLGNIAPGQKIILAIDRVTGTKFLWDNIDITAPEGWKKVGSKQVSTFNYEIDVPSDAAEGMYNITISARGDMQVLTPEIVSLIIDVDKEVYMFEIDPDYQVYIDASNSVPFTVRSESIATESVKLSIDGIPSSWVEEKRIVLAPGEKRKTFFVVNPKTEGVYPVQFKASLSSGEIVGSLDSQITVSPATLASKLRVLNEGFSIVTVILQPFYSLLSLIGSIF
jgi:uncharacterized membrane protein